MKRKSLILLLMLNVVFSVSSAEERKIRRIVVGSKTFTESVILGEIASQLIRHDGFPVHHREELGGTRFLWSALKNGDVDIYPEYTGTIAHEILADQNLKTQKEIKQAIHEYGFRMTEPLGFNNTYALGMTKERAKKLGIKKISDLKDHPGLKFGFSNEFMDREDGWPTLQEHYNLPQTNVKGMYHDLAYRGIANNKIDVIDTYATDAEIKYYDLTLLEDNLKHFPEYNAIYLYRADLVERVSGAVQQLAKLEGKFSEEKMMTLNSNVKIGRQSEEKVASNFLQKTFNIKTQTKMKTSYELLWRRTKEHMVLVAISLTGAILLAVPLGILAAKIHVFGQVILGAVGILQTIPSLALFVFMIPLMGIGTLPAIMALFLYSLLPIVRNTHAGLHDIPGSIRESAEALGLPTLSLLSRIELPLALRAILAGIKTSAVINIGTATLAALIGAGGYGQPILTGIRLDDIGLIMRGAVPAALMALAVQGLFEAIERKLMPAGLRYQST